MTSSATQDFLSDVLGVERISPSKLSYFETRLAGSVHQAMLKVFGRLEREKSFTRRNLAQRIGKKPEQITRWFSYPGNLTLATASDIFLGMGYEIESITLVDLETGRRMQCPDRHLDWARLANLYRREEDEQEREEIARRTALSDQSTNSGRAESLSAPAKSIITSALRGSVNYSSEQGRATAAECQNVRTSSIHTMGQEA